MTAFNGVNVASDAVSKMVTRADLVRKLFGGTDSMRKAGKEYLPREEAESEDSYKNRLARSVLYNATGKTVVDMTGKVFAKPIILESDVPEKIKPWCENIDLTGRHINVFAKDVFTDAMQVGISYLFVDMPKAVTRADGQRPTLADEQNAGIRPYVTLIPLERVLGWKSTIVNGAEQLTMFRFKECVTEPDPANEFAEKAVEQVKVLEPGTWRVFRQNTSGTGSNQDWVLHDSGLTSINFIPIVPVYVHRTDFMAGDPPLQKLAELNIRHWQSSSDQNNILHVARVPILHAAGFTNDDKLVIGAGTMVRSTDVNAKLEYVEHTGAAIKAGQDDIDKLEQQMQDMGLQLLVKQSGQTATGEVRDETKENSPLAAMATALQDALENVLDFMARYSGLGVDDGGSVKVNKDFSVAAQRNDLQQLLAVRQAGDLSQETLWDEMQRRDYLSDSFDPATEKDRIKSEPPTLDGPPMDLGAGSNNNGGPN